MSRVMMPKGVRMYIVRKYCNRRTLNRISDLRKSIRELRADAASVYSADVREHSLELMRRLQEAGSTNPGAHPLGVVVFGISPKHGGMCRDM